MAKRVPGNSRPPDRVTRRRQLPVVQVLWIERCPFPGCKNESFWFASCGPQLFEQRDKRCAHGNCAWAAARFRGPKFPARKRLRNFQHFVHEILTLPAQCQYLADQEAGEDGDRFDGATRLVELFEQSTHVEMGIALSRCRQLVTR